MEKKIIVIADVLCHYYTLFYSTLLSRWLFQRSLFHKDCILWSWALVTFINLWRIPKKPLSHQLLGITVINGKNKRLDVIVSLIFIIFICLNLVSIVFSLSTNEFHFYFKAIFILLSCSHQFTFLKYKLNLAETVHLSIMYQWNLPFYQIMISYYLNMNP